MICLICSVLPLESKDTVLDAVINRTYEEGALGRRVDWEWRAYTTVADEDSGDATFLLQVAISDDEESTSDTLLTDFIERIEGVESCEVWVKAPAPLPFKPENGYDIKFSPNVAESSRILKEWGVLWQENVLSHTIVEKLRQHVSKSIQEVDEKIRYHHPQIDIGNENFLFSEIASRSKHRFDLRLGDLDVFVEENLLGQEAIRSLIHTVLDGNDFNYDVSVVYSRPGADFQGWHSDGNHATSSEDAGWSVNGWETCLSGPYAICMFIPLIDLDDETGFTQFWPGSHRSKNWVGFGKVAGVVGSTFDGKGAAGSAFWYDYRTWHRGMPNRSNVLRPVLQVIFKQSWYIEKDNYGTLSIAKA